MAKNGYDLPPPEAKKVVAAKPNPVADEPMMEQKSPPKQDPEPEDQIMVQAKPVVEEDERPIAKKATSFGEEDERPLGGSKFSEPEQPPEQKLEMEMEAPIKPKQTPPMKRGPPAFAKKESKVE
jgi:hypothetical protein